MLKKILILCFFISLKTFAQNNPKLTLSGYISDVESQERLIGVSVSFTTKDNNVLGTSSNEYGFFSLTLDTAQLASDIRFSYLGYNTHYFLSKIEKDTQINISLTPNSEILEEVEITANKSILEDISVLNLPIQKIERIPALLGEKDVLKALQLLPGVKMGSEGTSGIYVRGGSPDQNLILLDGVPVYNASHMFGFFSVFNPDAINKVNLIKGGFPARYAGRLSSVVDINMKEGNLQKWHSEGSIGLISSKLMVEGPLKKDTSSILITARRTYYDLVAYPFLKSSAGDDIPNYYFYDFTVKTNYIFSPKSRLYWSFYSGKDKFFTKTKDTQVFENTKQETNEIFNLAWRNMTSALRWNYQLNKKIFANTSLIFSDYKLNVGINNITKETSLTSNQTKRTEEVLQYISTITDIGAKMDIDIYLHPKHSLRTGFSATHHQFKPSALQYIYEIEDSLSNKPNINKNKTIKAFEYDIYVENNIQILPRWKSNIGLHGSLFSVEGKNYASLQPRLSTSYLLLPNMSIKAAFATMQQYVHLLSNSNIGFPTDLWVSTTAKIPPQRSWQANIGFGGEISKALEWTIEAYYKDMKNVLEYQEGMNFLSEGSEIDFLTEGQKSWEDLVSIGKGWSYGAEFLLQKTSGKTNGWIGYTLAYANRKFADLNLGKTFPYRYDRRHDISVVMNHQFSKKIEANVTWVFATGNAITLPIAFYAAHPEINSNPSNSVDYYVSRNGFRTRNYHRLDVGISFYKQKKWGLRTWNIAVYNAYNRKNPYAIVSNKGRGGFTQLSLFTIIPSVSYQFKF